MRRVRCIARTRDNQQVAPLGSCAGHLLLDHDREPKRLFEQCRRIARALDGNELALAQIFGLYIPIDDLDRPTLTRLAAVAPFIKANFNPDEPRIPAGQPGGGEWTTGDESTADAADSPTNATAGSDGGGTGAASNGPAGGNDIGVGNSSGQIGGVDVGLIPAAYQGTIMTKSSNFCGRSRSQGVVVRSRGCR